MTMSEKRKSHLVIGVLTLSVLGVWAFNVVPPYLRLKNESADLRQVLRL